MSDLAENLFHNIAPFVTEISTALGVVFVVSFVVGWFYARAPARTGKGG